MPVDDHASPPHPPLTFVTVTFRAEDELQRLQAASLARYAPAESIARIIVIDNGEPRLRGRRRRRLLDAFDHLSSRVEIVPADEVSALPPASGWMGQQVLKLAIADRVPSPYYVLLDAKNHMIRPVGLDDLVAPDGRARGGLHAYGNHPLLPRLRTTLDYLGVAFDPVKDPFPRTATPFVMHTEVARAVVEDVEKTAGRPFAEEFVANDLSEFFLYSAWLLKSRGGWDDTYDGVPIQSPTVWGGRADLAGVRDATAKAVAVDAPFFAVHRRALTRLDAAARAELARWWVSRGLLDDDGAFRRLRRTFLTEYALSAVRARTIDRLRRP